MQHIFICHQCPSRQPITAGPCACTLDGVDIIDHAASGFCPAGKFDAEKNNAGAAVVADESTLAAVEKLVAEREPVCRSCPGGHFLTMKLNPYYFDISVLCHAAPPCCGGEIGEISLGHGECPKSYWQKPEAGVF